MTAITGQVPDGAREITTGQANRVWYVDGTVPYVLSACFRSPVLSSFVP